MSNYGANKGNFVVRLRLILIGITLLVGLVILAVQYCSGNIPNHDEPLGEMQQNANANESASGSVSNSASSNSEKDVNTDTPTANPSQAEDEIIADLYNNQASDVQVHGTGTVIRLLEDDNVNGKHQRFILELSNDHTLLIAHNIDVAPRLDGIDAGDTVEFYGEYYYSEEGGGIHWTHYDPVGEHIDGYLKWNGETYD